MKFIAFKLLGLVFEPGSLLVLVGLVGVAAGRRGRGLLVLCACGFTALLIVPLGQWALWPLEQRFPLPAVAPDSVAGIIVLGGAEEIDLTEQSGLPSFNGGMETLTTFIALSHRYPDAQLAFSGGSGTIADHHLSEADVVRQLFAQLGFTHPVIYEGRSRDTYENAVLLKRIVQPAPGSTWLLVTTASHMPRSVGCFRAAGWPVLAWPTSFKALHGWEDTFGRIGMGARLGDLATAMHEWQGLVAYWLLGRTNTLFPR